MRYYLHLQRTSGTVRDHEGSEYSDISLAKGEAIDAAREMMANAVRTGRDISDWAIVIVDDHDVVLERVPFAATLRRERSAPTNPWAKEAQIGSEAIT